MPEKTVGIIGGGMLGLTLAWRLAKRGAHVTLFEAAPHLGGLADAWRLGDVTWDRHYHVILLSDLRLRALLDELGLGDALCFGETRTGFFTDGRLHSMSNTWEFLTFPPLKLVDKLRLGATIFCSARRKDVARLDRLPVGEWVRRWSGERVYQKMWRPLLEAKLGEAADQASAAFLWSIINRMYAARRTGLKRERFGYVRGGYHRILTRFHEALTEAGVTLRCDAPVAQVVGDAGQVAVTLADGSIQRFDQVVVTTAPGLAAKLCPTLTEDERARLSSVLCHGVLCASLLLTRPLGGYYVTNLTDPGLPFTAVIELSALVPPAELGGHHLVYLPRYVTAHDPLLALDDEALRARFLAGLRRIYPDLTDAQVLAFKVSRTGPVLPVSTVDHLRRVPAQRTSVPGLFTVNGSQILDGTLNVNETIALAERAVALL